MNPFKGGCGKCRKHNSKCTKVEVKQEPDIKKEPEDSDCVVEISQWRVDGRYHANCGPLVEYGDDFNVWKNEIKLKEEEETSEENHSAPCQSNDSVSANDDNNRKPMGDAINVQPPKAIGNRKKRNGSAEKQNKRIIPKYQVTKKQKKHKCHVCNHLTSTKYNLKVHLRIHTGEKPFKCDVCSKSFKQKQHLNRHQKTHGEFRCPKCNQGFEQESIKIDHERLCNPRQFECNICGLKTKHKTNLTAHMRIHSGAKPFECPICIKSFKTKFELQRHSMTHIDGPPNACLKCGKRFDTPKDKQTHEMRCQRKLIKCEICNKRFVKQFKLSQHLYTTHNDQFPFQCSKCFGGYAAEDAKIAHENGCGHRQYQCHLCKEFGRDKCDLKIHMRKHHTGERIRCKVCATSYTSETHVIRHMKTVHRLKQ